MPWLVDGMNVIGSVPDGWWRDRTAAMRRLLRALGPLAAAEGPVELVLDGRTRDLGPVPDGVTVTWAPEPGPDAADRVIAARVREGGATGPSRRPTARWPRRSAPRARRWWAHGRSGDGWTPPTVVSPDP